MTLYLRPWEEIPDPLSTIPDAIATIRKDLEGTPRVAIRIVQKNEHVTAELRFDCPGIDPKAQIMGNVFGLQILADQELQHGAGAILLDEPPSHALRILHELKKHPDLLHEVIAAYQTEANSVTPWHPRPDTEGGGQHRTRVLDGKTMAVICKVEDHVYEYDTETRDKTKVSPILFTNSITQARTEADRLLLQAGYRLL